jgi:hypothetical protein
LSDGFEHYFECVGERIPSNVIHYHAIRFNLYTPMAVAPLVAAPPASIDLVQYLGWYWVWSRAAVEMLAHTRGIELEKLDLPEARLTQHSGGHDALVERLRTAASGDDFAAYEADTAYRIAEYLRRAERFGPGLDAAELAEMEALMGRRIGNWADANAQLEEFVRAAPSSADPGLVRFFHRRTLRQEALLHPVLRELQDASIQKP